MPTQRSHEAREMAESFGADARRYDRSRPRYPGVMVQAILADAPGPDVLDVGIGTGISALSFRAAGRRVLGVEVDERMAAIARENGFEVETAAFETWDHAGRAFDALISGQTWHWIDPVAGAAKAAEVLRPEGRLALFWNVFQPAPGVREAFAAVQRRVLPDAPLNPWARPALDGYTAILDRAADGLERTGAFRTPEQWRFTWERQYTRDEWLDQLGTSGLTGRLTPEQLAELLMRTGEAIDARGGTFSMPYVSVVLTATRHSGASSPAAAARLRTPNLR
jgi:SAM-dependent methyltransferase